MSVDTKATIFTISSIDDNLVKTLQDYVIDKINAYKKNLINSPNIGEWKLFVVNNNYARPEAMFILDNPIEVILKDKWCDRYIGYAWAITLENTGISKSMDSPKISILAYKFNSSDKTIHHFSYGKGSIKYSTIPIKVPKILPIPSLQK